MAFRKVFQEGLGNKGRGNKIQREPVLSIIDFIPKRMCWPSPTQKYEAEQKLWAEFFRIDLTIMCSVFSLMNNHKKGEQITIFIDRKPMSGRKLT